MYTARRSIGRPRQERWSSLTWPISLLFLAVPLLGILVTAGYAVLSSEADIEGRVLNAYTGDPVAGARVQFGEQETESGTDGRFGLAHAEVRTIRVTKDGYDPVNHEILHPEEPVEISLRPNTITGLILNRIDDTPLAGAIVEARLDGQTVSSTESGEDGTYRLTNVPRGAEVVITYPDYSSVVEDSSGMVEIDAMLRPAVISGTVTDVRGDPIPGATIAIGDVWTQAADDGSFRLEDAPEEGEIFIKAPGFSYYQISLDEQLRAEVVLDDKPVRAIYVTAGAAGDAERFEELLDLVDRTELNAMVIDTKDSSGYIFYDTQVPLAHEIGAVRPAYDVHEVLRKVKERDIYAISRQVVFEDPVLAEQRPDLAIQDSDGGGLWRTWNGLAWVSAYQEDVWEYNIALMLEQVELGFDEIQYDYIRFPSDGPLNRAEYGVSEHTSETRSDAVTEFLRRSHEAILPTPAYLAGDIFGLTLWELGDGGIGQNLEKVTAVLDYISPMIYPSHFYPGSMGFDQPNDHPYEVILWSLQNGVERIPSQKAKIRPWLQDFSYGPGIAYGPDEVRAQIDASNDFGASGWMLWSASSRYQEEALRQE